MAHLGFMRTAYRAGSAKAAGRIAYITGQHDEGKKPIKSEGREDLVYARTRNLPEWAGKNPYTYFLAAERYERANGVTSEEWKVLLPQELTHGQNMGLMRDLVTAIAADSVPITYAFHAPKTLQRTQEQPHLHLLISSRKTDGLSRSPREHFSRYNAAHPEQGGAQKDPRFWHAGAVAAHRQLLSDVINLHLEAAGVQARVHPGNLRDRGFARPPEPKLLPSESAAYRQHGIVSPTMQTVLTLRGAKQLGLGDEQAQARGAWEGRKAALGITPAMTMGEKVTKVVEARQARVTQAPAARTTPDLDKHWTPALLGNKLSKIYQVPGQHTYGDVAPANQVRFRTEREALAAGYRRGAPAQDGAAKDGGRTATTKQGGLQGTLARLARVLTPDDTPAHGHLDVELDPTPQQGRGWS